MEGKKRRIILNQFLVNHPSQSTHVFPQSEARCSCFILVQPSGQHHAGCARYFRCFTPISHSFSEDTSYFFCLFSQFLQFKDVSIFNTCDLGWFLGALFCCFTCLFTPYFSSWTYRAVCTWKSFTSWDWTLVFACITGKKSYCSPHA